MKNLKTRRAFRNTVGSIGAAGAVASAAVLIYFAASGKLTILSGILLAVMTAGSIYLAFLAFTVGKQLNVPSAGENATWQKRREKQPLVRQDDKTDKTFSRCISLLILLLCGVLFLLAYGKAQKTEPIAQSTVQTGIFYERGKVISVDYEEYQGQQDVEDVPIGSQLVTVELTSGENKGSRYQLQNNLSYLYGTVLKQGDSVTVSFSLTDGEVDSIVLQDYDRTIPLSIVLLLFLAITILVGGKIGAKSLLGLALTILCVFAVLIPLLLGGSETLPTILAMCTFVTVVEFVILDGVNKKTICAILGTFSGVLFAMLFGKFACYILRVNGFLMYVAEPSVEALLQLKQGQDPFFSLQIGDLLVGGILIAALGAVNDVAMSISSSMNELITVNPNLSRKELFRSGMNIGRDMVGTMTNTLILALVGSGLVLMIYLSSLTPSFTQLMSTAFLSVEMVQALSSSIGVILAVPLSVLIGMLLFGTKSTEQQKPKTRK